MGDVRRSVSDTSVVTRDVDVVNRKPIDLVRWGPIIAGLFAALSTLAVLTVLGLAVGLSSFTPGEDLSGFGIGAGIWAAVSALLAFAVGGFLAARTAAVSGHNNGILHGAMVWLVAIPLLLNLIGGGLGAIAQTLGGAVGTATDAAGSAVGAITDPAAVQATAQAAGTQVAGGAAATVQAVVTAVTSPQAIQAATDAARNAAWSTLLALGLSAGAAILGGYLGARPSFPTQQTIVRTEDRQTTS